MSRSAININEQRTGEAFTKQSQVFDAIYSSDSIIQYKRERVRSQLAGLLKPGSHILELNAGTGEDALWLAQQGHTIHATDIAEGMLKKLKEKISFHGHSNTVTAEQCSFTALDDLKDKGPYDMIFSNFAGLNCTNELDKVLSYFSSLLKPGGVVVLVLLPKFCLWETMLLFKGHFKTAFRRFSGKKGTNANVEGVQFRCWYYDPSFVRHHLKDSFDMISLEGLCTIVPPSYIEGFADKHPKWFHFLRSKEDKWKTKWPWRAAGDYYIISLRKK